MPLESFVGRYHEIPSDLRDAYLDLVIDHFLELPYPTAADFGRRYGVVPGSAAFDDRWAAIRAEARRINIAGANDAATIALIATRFPSGAPVILPPNRSSAARVSVRSGPRSGVRRAACQPIEC